MYIRLFNTIPLNSQNRRLLAVTEEIIEEIKVSLLRVPGRDLDERPLLDELVAGVRDVGSLPAVHRGLPVCDGLQLLHTATGLVDDRADVAHHVQGLLGGLVVRVGGGRVLDQLLRGVGGWGVGAGQGQGGEKEEFVIEKGNLW